MNAIVLAAALLALGAQDVETTPQTKTQLYVKTVPTGAEVTLDGKVLGKSDNLFDVASGAHRLTLRLDGYVPEERLIDARDGEITRVEVRLKKRSGDEDVLGYVGNSADGRQSYADSGHAVAFEMPAEKKSIVAVRLFATRYGYDRPPRENFHVYLLDENKKVLEHVAVPYSKIERGEPRWYTIDLPAIELPQKFFVAFWFNAERTKGVFMCKANTDKETHSYAGLPDKGYRKVDQSFEWMIRAVVSSEAGKKPTYPKVVTYEDEKAADTESSEALPTRTWNDATGAFSVEAQFAGVKDGKVLLKKADGKTVSVPLDQLSKEDQDFVAEQGNGKSHTSNGGGGVSPVEELSHDNGKSAGQSSIAGGGHAVKFKAAGNANYVTSVSLFGSRYGYPKPPPEKFQVWICDKNFKPIATFRFPYSSYVRGEPTWKSFRIRPTRVPEEFIVCFGFNPQQTKGVFVSYDDQSNETSLTGLPGGDAPKPFGKGNWLIRCKVENRSIRE
jgi:hypothetical protein